MARKSSGSSKKNDKNQNIVPVLFTLGVIGWGFFAIDRLTRPIDENQISINSESRKQTQSFRSHTEKKEPNFLVNNIKTWLTDAIESKLKKTKKEEKKIPVISEVLLQDDILEKEREHENLLYEESPIENINDEKRIKLYYYEQKGDTLKFYEVTEKLDGSENSDNLYAETFQYLLNGPSST